jgi:hypothetical protein
MTYQDTNLSNVENIGAVDRVNRMIVALTLVMVAVLFTAIPPAAVFSIITVSIYAGLTALIGWDPLFVVAKALSQRVPEQALATVADYPRQADQAEQSTDGDYKKAA